ncbi:MAG: hypothetical protein KGJ86_22500, partial [Chloroflexota bacterium]|nr:hypothetical protein [Chloroflexota bacterium]
KTKAQTAKGPVSVDQYHDVIQNIYVYQEGKQGNTFNQKVLKTYSDRSQFSEWTPEQLKRLNIGQMKGKWVGMTKDQLDKIVGG